MKSLSTPIVRCTAAFALALFAVSAQAHTGHGATSLAQGLVHPLGADHVLAMVAVGLWSAACLPSRQMWWGPATFVLSMVLGAGLAAMGARPAVPEPLIALSVVLFGTLLALSQLPTRAAMPAAASLALVALGAAVHGLAHGAEAPASGFAPYAIGFAATTVLLHAAGVMAALGLRRYLAQQATRALAGAGCLLAGSGLVLLGPV